MSTKLKILNPMFDINDCIVLTDELIVAELNKQHDFLYAPAIDIAQRLIDEYGQGGAHEDENKLFQVIVGLTEHILATEVSHDTIRVAKQSNSIPS